MRKHTINFPEIQIPKDNSVCPGCIQGKIPNQPFPASEHRANQPFQLIHSDLKTFPILSYYRQKYLIIFYDDFTSYAWISILTSKDKAIQATRQFFAFIENQYHASV